MHYYSVYLTLIRLEYLHKFCFLNLRFLLRNDTLKKGMQVIYDQKMLFLLGIRTREV